jgi:ribosomal protein S18 acetylase RimI-like enzyme
MQDILLQESTENDSEFFMELFGEIKNSELHLDMWPETIRNQMIRMQYNGFMQSVHTEFPEHIDYLILYQSEKAGRLQLDKNDKGFRIINISLLPAYRNIGIGSAIIQKIIEEANFKSIPVYLEVDKTNKAAYLYNKLGFTIYQQNEIKYLMIYSPEMM